MVKQILGDINNDGKIDAIDARICLKAASGDVSLDTEEAARADVNEDGHVNAVDRRWLFQHILGERIIDGVVE